MISILVSLLISFSHAIVPFPTSPDARLTTGSLCERAVELRYPERIKYCGRDVSGQEKEIVIQAYEKLGFPIHKIGREKFKIDHYIPLCMGGSNNLNNLWPQHESVYVFTDPLEALGCQKLAQGRIKQAALIQLIFQAKKTPNQAQKYFQMLSSL